MDLFTCFINLHIRGKKIIDKYQIWIYFVFNTIICLNTRGFYLIFEKKDE